MRISRPNTQEVAEGFVNQHLEDGDGFFQKLESNLKHYFSEARAGRFHGAVHTKEYVMAFELANEYTGQDLSYGLALHGTLEHAVKAYVIQAVSHDGFPTVDVEVVLDSAKETIRVKLATHYPFQVLPK